MAWDLLLWDLNMIDDTDEAMVDGTAHEPEPSVEYVWEAARCRTPPGEVILPSHFQGRLFWGGLSPVLNRDWLHWRRVTHVICCLGAFDGDGEETQAWRAAQNARAWTGNIQYQNWCVNRNVDQRRYLQLFTHLRQILEKVDSCVYVHCRSGKDRSAITVYAFLRGSLGYDDDSAREALATRVDRFGQSAANHAKTK